MASDSVRVKRAKLTKWHESFIRYGESLELRHCRQKNCVCACDSSHTYMYHCPLCELEVVSGTLELLQNHLELEHWPICVQYKDVLIVPCFMEHGSGRKLHFHCPVCPEALDVRPAFVAHLQEHLKAQNESPDLAYAPDPEQPQSLVYGNTTGTVALCTADCKQAGAVIKAHYHCPWCSLITFTSCQITSHLRTCHPSQPKPPSKNGSQQIDPRIKFPKWHKSIVRCAEDILIYRNKKRRYRCPLCKQSRQATTLSLLRSHFNKHHVACAVTHKGYTFLLCQLDTCSGEMGGEHFHCGYCGLMHCNATSFKVHLKVCSTQNREISSLLDNSPQGGSDNTKQSACLSRTTEHSPDLSPLSSNQSKHSKSRSRSEEIPRRTTVPATAELSKAVESISEGWDREDEPDNDVDSTEEPRLVSTSKPVEINIFSSVSATVCCPFINAFKFASKSAVENLFTDVAKATSVEFKSSPGTDPENPVFTLNGQIENIVKAETKLHKVYMEKADTTTVRVRKPFFKGFEGKPVALCLQPGKFGEKVIPMKWSDPLTKNVSDRTEIPQKSTSSGQRDISVGGFAPEPPKTVSLLIKSPIFAKVSSPIIKKADRDTTAENLTVVDRGKSLDFVKEIPQNNTLKEKQDISVSDFAPQPSKTVSLLTKTPALSRVSSTIRKKADRSTTPENLSIVGKDKTWDSLKGNTCTSNDASTSGLASNESDDDNVSPVETLQKEVCVSEANERKQKPDQTLNMPFQNTATGEKNKTMLASQSMENSTKVKADLGLSNVAAVYSSFHNSKGKITVYVKAPENVNTKEGEIANQSVLPSPPKKPKIDASIIETVLKMYENMRKTHQDSTSLSSSSLPKTTFVIPLSSLNKVPLEDSPGKQGNQCPQKAGNTSDWSRTGAEASKTVGDQWQAPSQKQKGNVSTLFMPSPQKRDMAVANLTCVKVPVPQKQIESGSRDKVHNFVGNTISNGLSSGMAKDSVAQDHFHTPLSDQGKVPSTANQTVQSHHTTAVTYPKVHISSGVSHSPPVSGSSLRANVLNILAHNVRGKTVTSTQTNTLHRKPALTLQDLVKGKSCYVPNIHVQSDARIDLLMNCDVIRLKEHRLYSLIEGAKGRIELKEKTKDSLEKGENKDQASSDLKKLAQGDFSSILNEIQQLKAEGNVDMQAIIEKDSSENGSKQQCPICKEEFSKCGQLTLHVMIDHDKYRCPLCFNVYIKREGLAGHLQAAHRPDAEGNVREHPLKNKLGVGTVRCGPCGYVFLNRKRLDDHQTQVHKQDVHLKCYLCETSFSRNYRGKTQLLRHINESHAGRINTKTTSMTEICDICGKKCKSMRSHMRSHRDARPFQCTTCGKSFKDKQTVQHHESMHGAGPESRRYICELCGKRFLHNLGRKCHMNKHLGLKPYKCEKCGKCFSGHSAFTNHRLVHSERTFSCNLCPKAFKEKAALKRHMCMHTGTSDFMCPHCDRAFGTNYILKMHIPRCLAARAQQKVRRTQGAVKGLRKKTGSSHQLVNRTNSNQCMDTSFDGVKLEEEEIPLSNEGGGSTNDSYVYRCSACELSFNDLETAERHIIHCI